jgi:hypothetical protein
VARVVVVAPDLLFGSKVQGMLAQAGHDTSLVPGPPGDLDGIDVLVVDLMAIEPDLDHGTARLVGFYAHTEPDVKARAEAAGFDIVVPRSRMNREGAELVARALG